MDFLNNVLTSRERLSLEDIDRLIPELTTEIQELKTDALQYTENIYVKYSERPKRNKMLVENSQQVGTQLDLIKVTGYETKKSLQTIIETMEGHIETITTIDCTLEILNTIIDANRSLINFVDYLDREDYLTCMEIICNLEKLIDDIPEDQYVDIYDLMKIKISDRKEMLIRDLKNILTEDMCITQNKENCYTFKIKKDVSNVEQALLALYYQASVVYPLHNIAKLLWDHFFVPIIDNIVKLELRESSKSYSLTISILDVSKKSNYKVVFANLELLLSYIKQHFNLKLNDKLTAMEYIGIDIRDNLSELFVKHCLEDTIPSTQEELQNYKTVISDIENLEMSLKASKIFDENTVSILDYASNIDILFINKKCREYLQQALEIMKKNLYEMTEVGVPYDPEKPVSSTSNKMLQCSVSKNVIELLDFLEQIMEQASSTTEVSAGRLFCTVQNIVMKFAEFVPEYHKKLLQTIPQQVALFYNDCYYIVYMLTDWNNRLCPSLPGVLTSCKFDKELFEMERIAAIIFNEYINGQMDQINVIMNESNLEGTTLEVLPSTVEKCVRQCLRQQELLKTVWHKVLSYPVYNSTIGEILNSLCDNIINRIIKFEDISSKAAEQLIEVLKIIMVRGPKLFTDPKEVSLYVPLWYKLNEVNFVLSNSLLDINDRWADGKGPLALQFKSTELKSLIRALFQNTDRRSAVLSRIVD